MTFLMVGVPEIYRNITSVLNKVEYLDLLHNIGRKLRLIGALNISQKIDVIKETEEQGYIQGHILGWTESDIISSTWGSSNIPYWMAIHFMEPDMGVSPHVLEDKELYNLVQELGIDLHELWKLGMSNVSDIFADLAKLKFVRSFECLRISGYNNSDRGYPSLPIPYSTPSGSGIYPQGAGNLFDVSTDHSIDLGLYLPSSWMPHAVCNGPNQPVPTVEFANLAEGANQPGWVTLHSMPATQYIGASKVEMPFPHGCTNFPLQTDVEIDSSQNCTLVQDRSHETPPPLLSMVSAGSSPDDHIATLAETVDTPPELDWGASSFSTPSTLNLNYSPISKEPFMDAPGSIEGPPMPPEPMPAALNPRLAFVQLLKRCRFGKRAVMLSEKSIHKVIDMEARFFVQDPLGTLIYLSSQWETNLSPDLNGLRLPLVWKGIQGAANYLQELDNHDANPIHRKSRHLQDTMAERFALIFLVINYKELCRHPEKYTTRSKEKASVTSILNSTLDAYPEDPRISCKPQTRRNKISGNYCPLGRMCWRLGSSLGLWVWLVKEGLIHEMANKSFTDNEIDALATLSVNTRPNTLRILQSLDSAVISIILGKDPSQDLQTILENNLMGADILACAHDEDQNVLARQCMVQETHQWAVQHTKNTADEEMVDLLAIL